jgi:hypothetical protein
MNEGIGTSDNLTTESRPKQSSKRRIVVLCLAALYLPYAWLLFVESLWPWNAPHWNWTQLGITPWTWPPHHWQWIKLWPILPGWIPTLVFNSWVGIGKLADWLEFLIGGLVSAGIIAGVVWAAYRGGRCTTATLIACFVVSCAFSAMAYQLYAW